ncbi:MAG: recombinase RecT [bacterium]|jgi:recombination protein RecT
MSNTQLTTKQFFQREDVKSKFTELLGTRTNQFMTSLLSIVNNNNYLKNASPESIYTSAMMAASLDLPINQNLGFAYIIPYGSVAQFQVGYKGLIQLALRSGQFKTISVTPVYEGQLLEQNPLTGFKFDFGNKLSDNVIGYAAYFSLINGFEKTMYMSKEEVTAHGKKYSKTFSNGTWAKDFDAMAQKTVLKLLISKYAPLSIEMQKAVTADQAVIKNVEDMEVEYVDNGHDISIKIEEVTQNATARIDKLKNKTND